MTGDLLIDGQNNPTEVLEFVGAGLKSGLCLGVGGVESSLTVGSATRSICPDASLLPSLKRHPLLHEISLSWACIDFVSKTMKKAEPLPVRILTHNVRYATTAPFGGEAKWELRRPHLINELRFNTAHCAESFICLQEVLHGQLDDIICGLNREQQEWRSIGVGRDDGHEAGEYSPILYRPGIWERKSFKNLWLSETPDRPSKSWDAASVRILTIGVFLHRQTRKTLIAMNTHLDDQGSRSRLEAAKIILQQIRHFSNGASFNYVNPIFLAGDFNSEPDQEAYNEMTSKGSPMMDLHFSVPVNQRYANIDTFTGFDEKKIRPKRIDFIFLNRVDSNSASNDRILSEGSSPLWFMDGYAILPNRFDTGIYISDHIAVVSDVRLV